MSRYQSLQAGGVGAQLLLDLLRRGTVGEEEGDGPREGGEDGQDDEHAEVPDDGGQGLREDGDQRRRRGGARHDQAVVLGAVPRPEALSRGGRKENKVATEREEYRPDPDGEGRLLTELREVERGEEESDEGGDHDHALLVAEDVAEVAPHHAAPGVEYCRESPDHCQEVIVLDEGLSERLVHGVDVANSLQGNSE